MQRQQDGKTNISMKDRDRQALMVDVQLVVRKEKEAKEKKPENCVLSKTDIKLRKKPVGNYK